MTGEKKPGQSLRQTEPGTYWFRVGLVVFAGILFFWLASSFAMTLLFPRQWVLTVSEPEEKTGFSRAFHTQAECEIVLSRWHMEAERFRREGKPALAPSASCTKLQ